MWECQIDFTSELGVFAAFLPFDVIPQFLTLTQKRCGGGRRHHLGMNDAPALAVIMKLVRLVVP